MARMCHDRFAIYDPLIIFLVLIGACKGPHVPGDYKGNVEVTIVNGYHRQMCRFSILTTTDDDVSENWLGTGSRVQPLAPDAVRVFSIKPGSYFVNGAFCIGSNTSEVAGSPIGTPTTIDSPTMIVLGPKPAFPRLNQKLLVFAKIESVLGPAVYGNAPEAEPESQSCAAAGARVISLNDCCEMGHGHQSPGANGQTVGEPWYCD